MGAPADQVCYPAVGGSCQAGGLACITVAPAGSFPMPLYHWTDAANDTLRDGLRDGGGRYMSTVMLAASGCHMLRSTQIDSRRCNDVAASYT